MVVAAAEVGVRDVVDGLTDRVDVTVAAYAAQPNTNIGQEHK